jgi:peroxiredoxin
MTDSTKLAAGQTFPVINASFLDGSSVELGKATGETQWQLVVIYRGKHCPLCVRYLNLLEEYKQLLADINVSLVAISADSEEQLTETMDKLNISYPIAYGLTETQMKQLGLYISEPRSAQETDHNFAEPAFFVVNEHGTVQAANIANAPFLRPEPEVLVNGLKFVRSQGDYPIRGTVAY